MSPTEFERRYRMPDIYDFMNGNGVDIVLAHKFGQQLLVTGPFPAKKCGGNGNVIYWIERAGARITNQLPLDAVLKGESSGRLIRCKPLQ